jgi:sugar lactone lactonase YvrE
MCLFEAASNAQNLLNNPESVVFDSDRNRYLVSNWGDGAIVQIDSTGIQSYFSTAIQNKYRVAGLYILNNTLLAASGDTLNSDTTEKGLTGFDLETGEIIFHIPIPGIGLPNDITSDKNGIIYLTDYWGDKLYRIDHRTPSIMIKKGLNYPNGIIYDEINNRLIILSVGGEGAPLLSVDLKDTSLSIIIKTGLTGGTDGITMDSEGNYYVSEWEGDTIYKLDKNFTSPPIPFSSGHNDPADIYYDEVNNILVVPNFGSNSIDFISLK